MKSRQGTGLAAPPAAHHAPGSPPYELVEEFHRHPAMLPAAFRGVAGGGLFEAGQIGPHDALQIRHDDPHDAARLEYPAHLLNQPAGLDRREVLDDMGCVGGGKGAGGKWQGLPQVAGDHIAGGVHEVDVGPARMAVLSAAEVQKTARRLGLTTAAGGELDHDERTPPGIFKGRSSRPSGRCSRSGRATAGHRWPRCIHRRPCGHPSNGRSRR